jgi:hypothetical protein
LHRKGVKHGGSEEEHDAQVVGEAVEHAKHGPQDDGEALDGEAVDGQEEHGSALDRDALDRDALRGEEDDRPEVHRHEVDGQVDREALHRNALHRNALHGKEEHRPALDGHALVEQEDQRADDRTKPLTSSTRSTKGGTSVPPFHVFAHDSVLRSPGAEARRHGSSRDR